MYGVLFWTDDDTLMIAQNSDNTVWVAETIKEADAKADEIEAAMLDSEGQKVECRVISLESVSE